VISGDDAMKDKNPIPVELRVAMVAGTILVCAGGILDIVTEQESALLLFVAGMLILVPAVKRAERYRPRVPLAKQKRRLVLSTVVLAIGLAAMCYWRSRSNPREVVAGVVLTVAVPLLLLAHGAAKIRKADRAAMNASPPAAPAANTPPPPPA
jgi:uncharacterized membrane protein